MKLLIKWGVLSRIMPNEQSARTKNNADFSGGLDRTTCLRAVTSLRSASDVSRLPNFRISRKRVKCVKNLCNVSQGCQRFEYKFPTGSEGNMKGKYDMFAILCRTCFQNPKFHYVNHLVVMAKINLRTRPVEPINKFCARLD